MTSTIKPRSTKVTNTNGTTTHVINVTTPELQSSITTSPTMQSVGQPTNAAKGFRQNYYDPRTKEVSTKVTHADNSYTRTTVSSKGYITQTKVQPKGSITQVKVTQAKPRQKAPSEVANANAGVVVSKSGNGTINMTTPKGHIRVEQHGPNKSIQVQPYGTNSLDSIAPKTGNSTVYKSDISMQNGNMQYTLTDGKTGKSQTVSVTPDNIKLTKDSPNSAPNSVVQRTNNSLSGTYNTTYTKKPNSNGYYVNASKGAQSHTNTTPVPTPKQPGNSSGTKTTGADLSGKGFGSSRSAGTQSHINPTPVPTPKKKGSPSGAKTIGPADLSPTSVTYYSPSQSPTKATKVLDAQNGTQKSKSSTRHQGRDGVTEALRSTPGSPFSKLTPAVATMIAGTIMTGALFGGKMDTAQMPDTAYIQATKGRTQAIVSTVREGKSGTTQSASALAFVNTADRVHKCWGHWGLTYEQKFMSNSNLEANKKAYAAGCVNYKTDCSGYVYACLEAYLGHKDKGGHGEIKSTNDWSQFWDELELVPGPYSLDMLQPGDIINFQTKTGGHIIIYAGNGRKLHWGSAEQVAKPYLKCPKLTDANPDPDHESHCKVDSTNAFTNASSAYKVFRLKQ